MQGYTFKKMDLEISQYLLIKAFYPKNYINKSCQKSNFTSKKVCLNIFSLTVS